MNYIGVDTSCYTTSLAVVDGSLKVLFDGRIPLEVRPGERGLRQSEAVFQHVRNMPALVERACKSGVISDIRAVGASAFPRRAEGSYMPVFIAGLAFARVLAQTARAGLLELSHQEGHIMSAMWPRKPAEGECFLSVHMSGGTTEILKTTPKGAGFEVSIVGRAADINAGQLVDRAGVAMGLQFPCGRELESLAAASGAPVELPVTVRGGDINFSGAEAQAVKYIKNGSKKEDVALGVLLCIARSICEALQNCAVSTGIDTAVIAGGVSSNGIIRRYMAQKSELKLHFGRPEHSGDNAVGVAVLAALADRGGVI